MLPTDTKGLACAHDGEIILQQKPKNTNNSLILQTMFMILVRLPFLMLWLVLHKLDCFKEFFSHRVHLFKFSIRVILYIHIF